MNFLERIHNNLNFGGIVPNYELNDNESLCLGNFIYNIFLEF